MKTCVKNYPYFFKLIARNEILMINYYTLSLLTYLKTYEKVFYTFWNTLQGRVIDIAVLLSFLNFSKITGMFWNRGKEGTEWACVTQQLSAHTHSLGSFKSNEECTMNELPVVPHLLLFRNLYLFSSCVFIINHL